LYWLAGKEGPQSLQMEVRLKVGSSSLVLEGQEGIHVAKGGLEVSLFPQHFWKPGVSKAPNSLQCYLELSFVSRMVSCLHFWELLWFNPYVHACESRKEEDPPGGGGSVCPYLIGNDDYVADYLPLSV